MNNEFDKMTREQQAAIINDVRFNAAQANKNGLHEAGAMFATVADALEKYARILEA